MEFEFLIPENARLRAHIFQRSNLKYVKTVMDHFDERQREDFRNSPLGYLADIPDIQFSAQLILQLLFRTICTEKVNELWFNVQCHMMRFGLQEYAAVTGLRCGVFPEGDDFDRLIERKRLKERFGKKFEKAKRRKEKEITCTVHDFPIAMQVWAFEAISEIGERFGQRVGERLPRILRWSARKQPQHRTYDAFFKNVQLHVYVTFRPTDAEAEQPYLSSLVPYDDPPVPVLDDIVRTIVAPQIHSLHAESGVGGQSGGQDLEDRVRSGRSGDGETSGDDESDGESGSDSEGDDSEDTGDSSTPPGAPIRSPERGCTTNSLPVQTSASSLTKGEVEELLLDQRILFEMRLRTVKLEIEQHVTFECTRLREFIAAQVTPHPPITAPRSTGAIFEPDRSGCSPQDVHGRGIDPLLTPIELGVDTGRSQPPEGADILPCPDAEHEPLPTPIDDQEDGAAIEPSDVAAVSDAEIDGCNVTDGEGIVATVPVPAADVPVPASVPEGGGRVSTTRWRSARLRRPAPTTRTPYTRGRGKTLKK
ncbi:Hypothetical predicted protein [Olea europaea subsp. europaea]|uniref:DUF1985 domain-containing protein n=1 Tax=Olea europaea subsp. europaea TaxID=158383 RepID=A0A8S0TLY7_OLEEU|nr:Hypothetical predicted protein [Olea europaea subsp. europaea]